MKPQHVRRSVVGSVQGQQAVERAGQDSGARIDSSSAEAVEGPTTQQLLPPPPPEENSYNARKRTLQVMKRRKRDAALAAASAAQDAAWKADALKAGLFLARIMRVRHTRSPDMQFLRLREASSMIHQRMSEAAAFSSSSSSSQLSATAVNLRLGGRTCGLAREHLRYHLARVWLLARLHRCHARIRHARAVGELGE